MAKLLKSPKKEKGMCEKLQQTFDSLLKEIETLKAAEAKETQELKVLTAKVEEAEKRLKETKVQLKETKAKIKTLTGKKAFSSATSRRKSKIKSTQSKAKKAAKSLAKCQGKEFGSEQVDNLLALIDTQKEPLAYLLSLSD